MIIADTPKTSKMLTMLLPTTFPTATSALPVSAACKLTPSSGALVPNATTVKPITSGVIRNDAASAAAPRTKNSPPMTSNNSPNRIWPASSITSFHRLREDHD